MGRVSGSSRAAALPHGEVKWARAGGRRTLSRCRAPRQQRPWRASPSCGRWRARSAQRRAPPAAAMPTAPSLPPAARWRSPRHRGAWTPAIRRGSTMWGPHLGARHLHRHHLSLGCARMCVDVGPSAQEHRCGVSGRRDALATRPGVEGAMLMRGARTLKSEEGRPARVLEPRG